MTKHDHHKHCCEHKVLTHCKVCDGVYCEDCGKEWVASTLPQWSWTTTSIPFDSGNTIPGRKDYIFVGPRSHEHAED